MSHNTGLILDPIPCDCLPLGAIGATQEDLVPDGDGEPFLPVYEPQNVDGFETMACVSYSLNTHLESQVKLLGLGERNWSDRYLAKSSATTQQGNTFSNVYAAMQRDWSCLEHEWPMPPSPTWLTYYADLSAEAIAAAEREHPNYRLGMRVWVPMTFDGLRSALKKLGTLWCHSDRHAFVVYRVDDRVRIFDTYPYGPPTDKGKRTLPLSAIGTNDLLGAFYVPLFINKPTIMTFREKTLYQLMDAPGGFLHYRNGVLVRDTEAKLQAEWVNINSVQRADQSWYFSGGPTGKLTLADLAGVPLFNTKGEPVTLGNPV